MYEVQQGQVEGVEYYPPKKYDHLYCGDPAERRQRLRKQAKMSPLIEY